MCIDMWSFTVTEQSISVQSATVNVQPQMRHLYQTSLRDTLSLSQEAEKNVRTEEWMCCCDMLSSGHDVATVPLNPQ